MKRHVYSEKPKFCNAIKPGEVLVQHEGRKPETIYVGPPDHDEQRCLVELLRDELDRAAAILASRK